MIMPPPCMMPFRRKTKQELADELFRSRADKIMTAFAAFQPKKKRKKKFKSPIPVKID